MDTLEILVLAIACKCGAPGMSLRRCLLDLLWMRTDRGTELRTCSFQWE